MLENIIGIYRKKGYDVRFLKTRLSYLLIFLSIPAIVCSQTGFDKFLTPSDTLNTNRRNAVIISEASLATLTLIGLNQLWYTDFPKSKLHSVNDFDEWQQMDKMGHVFSAYQLTRIGAEALDWSGVSEKNQLIYSSALSLGFLTTVEIFDGYSKEWGFSWSDVAANIAGTGIYVGQELLWQEQRITMKYSFHRTSLASKRPDKLGDGFFEEALKDYNGQTIWLSANVNAFTNTRTLPKWLNIAVGYGANGMLTGISEPDIFGVHPERYRQFYLSLDVDLTRIDTKSRFLKSVFSLINVLKIPAPTIEYNGKNRLTFHLLYL